MPSAPRYLDPKTSQEIREFFLQEDAQNDYWTRQDLGRHIPEGWDLDAIWANVAKQRRAAADFLSLRSQSGTPFTVWPTSEIQRLLHEIDIRGADSIYRSAEGTFRQELLADVLVAEAMRSSQIEGAVTTLVRARELVKRPDPPKDRHDRMVYNNYRALLWIAENRDRSFSDDLLLELHRIVTEGALDDPAYAGRFRDGPVNVVRLNDGEVVYTPPPAPDLSRYLAILYSFANGGPTLRFLHPVVRASVIHFYLVYVHPFSDGNGRTARALFYHSLLRDGYDAFRYLSISSVLLNKRSSYYDVIRRSEDETDVTPFILFSCRCIEEAIQVLRNRVDKTGTARRTRDLLADRGVVLNERQLALVERLLDHPLANATVRDHARRRRCVYQTARTDILDLVDRGLLRPIGKTRKEVRYALQETFFQTP